MNATPISQSLLIGSCVLICFLATAQQKTLTITGQAIVDAGVHNNTRPDYTNSVTTNYGTNPRLADFAWTHGGYDMFFRSMLYFRLDSIPKGSTIQSILIKRD